MSNINSLLNVGHVSLVTQQNNIHITGNNIANVDTPGYSRQTPNIVERPALNVYPGQIGQGAWTQEVLRHFDYFVERNFLQKNAAQTRSKAEHNLLTSVESVFNEANSDGVSSLLGKFLSSWSKLASTPNSQPVREDVISNGQNLASTIRQTEEYLSTYQARIDTYIQQDVEAINKLLQQIADLNKQINVYDVPGHNNANTLLDQRDQLVRELSTYVDVDIVNRGSGDYTVYTKAGHTLVENITAFSLSFDGPKSKKYIADASVSTYDDVAKFTGSSYNEYTLEFLSGGAVGTATYRVSLDGGNSWLKDENGNDKLFTATDSNNMADVNGLNIYFDGTGNFGAGDRYEIVPKSAVYWITPTTQPLNISPQLMGNGSENPRRLTGGSLAASLKVRDYDIGSYREQLDNFAKNLIWQVNREHSQGVGNVKNDYMQGSNGVQNPGTALGHYTSGLEYHDYLQEGNVMFYIYDSATGKLVDPPAYGPLDFNYATPPLTNFDPSQHGLDDVAAAINGSYGTFLNATIQDNKLVINTTSDQYQFAVGNDTSGLMAALGLNTYFTGDGSADIAINEAVSQNSDRVCAGAVNGALEGNVGDNDVARAIAGLTDKKVWIPGVGMKQGTETTLLGYYGTLVGKIGTDTRQAYYTFQYENALASDLDARQAEVSGVNLDEELTLLIKYQNSYKAAAKLVTTADQMFQTLLGLKQ